MSKSSVCFHKLNIEPYKQISVLIVPEKWCQSNDHGLITKCNQQKRIANASVAHPFTISFNHTSAKYGKLKTRILFIHLTSYILQGMKLKEVMLGNGGV